jgi:hypothetical protein
MSDPEYPPVPSRVFSVLGMLPVTHKTELTDLGELDFTTRSINLQANLVLSRAWQVYWHEVTHLALHDGGVQDLDAELEERVCDALGTYLAAAIRSGFLKINLP